MPVAVLQCLSPWSIWIWSIWTGLAHDFSQNLPVYPQILVLPVVQLIPVHLFQLEPAVLLIARVAVLADHRIVD